MSEPLISPVRNTTGRGRTGGTVHNTAHVPPPTCYRFAGFVLSRQKRQLFREGHPVPLIPRYFDLLVLLIERRETAVSKRDIFDSVWGDVIVSDGALSQAVRTLRRVLGVGADAPVSPPPAAPFLRWGGRAVNGSRL